MSVTQASMKASSKTANSTEGELLLMWTIGATLEIGKMALLKAEGYLLGLTGINTKANTKMVLSTGVEFFIFRVGRSSKAPGKMAKSMAMGSFK